MEKNFFIYYKSVNKLPNLGDYGCAKKAGIECIIVDDSRIASDKIEIDKHCPFSSLIDEIKTYL